MYFQNRKAVSAWIEVGTNRPKPSQTLRLFDLSKTTTTTKIFTSLIDEVCQTAPVHRCRLRGRGKSFECYYRLRRRQTPTSEISATLSWRKISSAFSIGNSDAQIDGISWRLNAQNGKIERSEFINKNLIPLVYILLVEKKLISFEAIGPIAKYFECWV